MLSVCYLGPIIRRLRHLDHLDVLDIPQIINQLGRIDAQPDLCRHWVSGGDILRYSTSAHAD